MGEFGSHLIETGTAPVAADGPHLPLAYPALSAAQLHRSGPWP